MEKSILLFIFFISSNTYSAHNETTLLSLPSELIYYIFNCIHHKSDYKNLIISQAFYNHIYNYLLYKQDLLLSKQNIADKEKDKIISNNRLLLGYLRNNKEKIDQEDVKKWTHGVLKYICTQDFDTLFYAPSIDAEKKLYKICILNTVPLELNNTDIDFLEWVYPENHKKGLETIIGLTKLKTNTQIIKVFHSLEYIYVLNKTLEILLGQTHHVQLVFEHPTPLSLPGNFNKLHIKGPITGIYCDKKFNSWEYTSSKNKKEKKSSLSLQLLIDEKTSNNSFADISRLDYLKKLTLNFDKNSHKNKDFFLACPPNLETLILKNCGYFIFIPKKLKSLKIIAPQKECSFKLIDSKIPDANQLLLIGQLFEPSKHSLDSLCIKNDQNDYVKNILFKLEMPQLPKNLIIKNCSYKTLESYQPHSERKKLARLLNSDYKKLLEND